MVLLKEFFEKDVFEKNQQTTIFKMQEKFPSMQRANESSYGSSFYS